MLLLRLTNKDKMIQKSNISSTIKKARKEMSEQVAQSYGQYHILKGNGHNPVRCQVLGYSPIETMDNDAAFNYFNLKTEL